MSGAVGGLVLAGQHRGLGEPAFGNPLVSVLSVSVGALTANAGSGHAAIAGWGRRQLTLSGTAADINAALATAQFVDSAPGNLALIFTPTDTINNSQASGTVAINLVATHAQSGILADAHPGQYAGAGRDWRARRAPTGGRHDGTRRPGRRRRRPGATSSPSGRAGLRGRGRRGAQSSLGDEYAIAYSGGLSSAFLAVSALAAAASRPHARRPRSRVRAGAAAGDPGLDVRRVRMDLSELLDHDQLTGEELVAPVPDASTGGSPRGSGRPLGRRSPMGTSSKS